MNQLKIYLARPISGCNGEEVIGYYDKMNELLTSMGYFVFQPMTGKGFMRTEIEFKAKNYGNPESTNHAIIERDRWMVSQADIVFANLLGTERVSIGTCMELAWAHDKGKHTIVAMEKDNIHQHGFVLEAADIIYDDVDAVINYLTKFAKQAA